MTSPRILALDVYYRESSALAAGVSFSGWHATTSDGETVVEVHQIADYRPGEFFLRELPCLLAVLEKVEQSPEILIVDGFVWLSEDRPGLGAKLFDAINGRAAVIGVAKTRFQGAPAVEVFRGTSRSPLFVSAVGTEPHLAATWVKSMSGPYRIPMMLKHVDQISRR